MLVQVIWWSGISLEIFLLVRAFKVRLWARYPAFYTYISFVCLQSLLRFSIFHLRSQLYPPVYWITEWLGVLIGCGVVFEVYRVGLAAYPGTARMARNLLGFVFVMAFAKAVAETWNDPHWWLIATTLDLERLLRTVQCLAILALVVLFLFYAIPFGRNLRGILVGYGLFAASIRTHIISRPRVLTWLRRTFAGAFVALGASPLRAGRALPRCRDGPRGRRLRP